MQVSVAAPFQCLQARLLQPGNLLAEQGLRRDIGQRLTAPQLQRLREQRSRLLPLRILSGRTAFPAPGGE